MIKPLTKMYEHLAVKTRILEKLGERYYTPMVEREVQTAAIRQDDRVLFIGGGPLPMSALLIARFTHATVDIVDCDKRALSKARHFLSKYDVPISFIHARGEEMVIDRYSVIIIAKQVMPKACVLRQLLDQASSGTRILYRESRRAELTYPSRVKRVGQLCLIVAA